MCSKDLGLSPAPPTCWHNFHRWVVAPAPLETCGHRLQSLTSPVTLNSMSNSLFIFFPAPKSIWSSLIHFLSVSTSYYLYLSNRTWSAYNPRCSPLGHWCPETKNEGIMCWLTYQITILYRCFNFSCMLFNACYGTLTMICEQWVCCKCGKHKVWST